jgi:hypothetical protein
VTGDSEAATAETDRAMADVASNPAAGADRQRLTMHAADMATVVIQGGVECGPG